MFEISKLIPIIQEKKNIFFTIDNKYEENKYIKEFIGKEKKVLKEKKEVYLFINRLMGYLEVKLYNLVLQNPTGYLIAIYRILDYNLQMTPVIMEVLKTNLNEKDFEDRNIGIIANSINCFKQQVEEAKFKEVLKLIENIIATDKQAFQKITNYILSYNLKYSNINIRNFLEIENLIEISRGIYRTLSLRQEMVSNIESNILIIENEKIYIRAEKQIFKTSSNNIYDLLSSSLKSSFIFDNKINELMKTYMGLDKESIDKAISKISEEGELFPGIVFFDDDGLHKFLKNIFLVDDNNTKKIKEELTLINLNMSKVPKDLSLKEGRLLRKSILKIEEGVYICSKIIFLFSLAGLIADITEGTVSNKKFQGKLFKYIHTQHLEFENNIKELLEENILYKSLYKGVHETFFKEFSLPGEIDILIIVEDTLFVIECKAFSLKFDISRILSEVKKVKGTNDSKSIQQKLKFKIDTLTENKETVELYLGCEINKILGVIVTKNPSLSYQAETGFFDAIHSSELLDYINSRT
ncbi:hypothetical protein [Bacillus subtilis]|uniref:hypothetical protein n=2 Tax=Bacillus subtilis TaxID=1423 RepID=UPI00119BCE40|nr:hypothetical protein [Bacillus subtilis]TWG68981.1 hypothetical protein L605_000800000650 [Bacillus subtilis J26]TWG71453.1 hypothetical protein L607_000100009400 [Bacillus subtilis J24]